MFKPAEDRDGCGRGSGSADAFAIGVNAANNDAIRKAPAEMMLAFAKFNATHPEAILSLHTGVRQDGGQDMEAIAENLGITDRVRVVDQYRYPGGWWRRRIWRTGTGPGCAVARRVRGGFRAAYRRGAGVRCAGDHDQVPVDGGAEPGGAPGGRGAVLERGAPGVVDARRFRRWWGRSSRRLRSGGRWTGWGCGRSVAVRGGVVAEQFMGPVDELLGGMAARRGHS